MEIQFFPGEVVTPPGTCQILYVECQTCFSCMGIVIPTLFGFNGVLIWDQKAAITLLFLGYNTAINIQCLFPSIYCLVFNDTFFFFNPGKLWLAVLKTRTSPSWTSATEVFKPCADGGLGSCMLQSRVYSPLQMAMVACC